MISKLQFGRLWGRATESLSGQAVHNLPKVNSLWASVNAVDKRAGTTHMEQLEAAGLQLPAPDQLPDQMLGETLGKAIELLATCRIFLHHTDHLSDRQLYEYLWWELLREEAVDMRNFPETSCHLDILGSGSEEEQYIYLKYYADERERQFWAEQYPDVDMPAHTEPPYPRAACLSK